MNCLDVGAIPDGHNELDRVIAGEVSAREAFINMLRIVVGKLAVRLAYGAVTGVLGAGTWLTEADEILDNSQKVGASGILDTVDDKLVNMRG